MVHQLAGEVASDLDASQWIRKMFEEGNRLRKEFGAENVYDYSLGNPHLEPPPEVLEKIRQLANEGSPGMHRYMPNPGFPEVRRKVAEKVGKQEGCVVPAENIVMTGGAAPALNIVFHAMLDPGDNVVLFSPFFQDYRFQVLNNRGQMNIVETDVHFNIDLEALDRAINPRTRAVLVNSPNNPTGRVYPAETIDGLCDLLRRHNKTRQRPIVVVTDEPYRKIIFDGIEYPSFFPRYEHTVRVASFSKDLGLAGERIGYAAVHPDFPQAGMFVQGLIYSLRNLGFINAPAMMQLVVADTMDTSVDVSKYERNRNLLYDGLTKIGYQIEHPQGAFFLFPKSPLANELDFIAILQSERILAVPGRGFGRQGYFRLSYTCPPEAIPKSIPAFERALQIAKAKSANEVPH